MTFDHQRIVATAQNLIEMEIQRGDLSKELIESVADRTFVFMGTNPSSEERCKVINELETRFNIWVPESHFIEDHVDHEPWLKEERKTDWRYWARYRQLLSQKSGMNPASVDAIDKVTDKILGLLEDPDRDGAWDRRGMVVGHVQAGKTSNYIGLINKAADAGYKVIIVLAGMHKNLRSQTQIRLDEGFLGFETSSLITPDDVSLVLTGVGKIDPTLKPGFVTNRSDNGDFKTSTAKNFGVSPEIKPWLFVVKKNATVLKIFLAGFKNPLLTGKIRKPADGLSPNSLFL